MYSLNTLGWTILQWKDLVYPEVVQNKYLISSTGLIYNKMKQNYVSTNMINSGYLCVHLSTIDGKCKNFLLHRLVAYNFCNPPDCINNMTVNHIDGNKIYNYDTNLEWVTNSENVNHAIELGLYDSNLNENQHMAKLNTEKVKVICECLEKGMKYSDILSLIGMDPNNDNNHDLIGNIKRGISWKNISKDYNIQNHTGRKYTEDQIHQICSMLEQGYDRKSIYKSLTGDDLDKVPGNIRKNFNEYIRLLIKGERKEFNHIVSCYNITKFNDYPEIG